MLGPVNDFINNFKFKPVLLHCLSFIYGNNGANISQSLVNKLDNFVFKFFNNCVDVRK